MPIDELFREDLDFIFFGKNIVWEQREKRSVPEIAREKIGLYLKGRPHNTRSVFVSYQVEHAAPGFWNRLARRRPVFRDHVLQGDAEGEIKLFSWDRKKRRKIARLDEYLANAEYAHLSFLYGSHHDGNCVIEWNAGSSRIGSIQKIE